MRVPALLIATAALACAGPSLAWGSGKSSPHKPRPHAGKADHKPPHFRHSSKGIPAWQLPKLKLGQPNRNSNVNRNWNRNSIANRNSNSNRNANSNRNVNSNRNSNRNSASAIASSNVSNDASLRSDVTVHGDTFIHKERHRRIPVNTAYAAPLTSGLDTCLGSASAGVQTSVLGLTLGGTRRDYVCERIKLSRELHAMGMREAAVHLLCADVRVRNAMLHAGTPCEAVTYGPPPAYYAPPPPPQPYHPPAERG